MKMEVFTRPICDHKKIIRCEENLRRKKSSGDIYHHFALIVEVL